MPFITKNAAQIRTDILRDIKNLLQLSDDTLGPDSDWYIRASSVASVAEGLYQHQGWIVRQIFPDTVDVVITSAGGLPSQDVIDRVQAHIDDVRPVTAKNTLVLIPVIRNLVLLTNRRISRRSLYDYWVCTSIK